MPSQGADKPLAEAKTLRVQLPPDLHMRLRSLKIVTGKGMSETVVEALEEYFENRQRDGGEGEHPD